MTKERTIEIIQTEKKCVARANICGRDCANCDLVMPEDNILTAYDRAIKALLETGEVGYGKNLLDGKPGGAFCLTGEIVDKGNGVEEFVLNKTLLLMNEQSDCFEKFVMDVTDALKKLDAEMDEIRRKYGVFP